MENIIKRIIKRIIKGERATSESYIKYLRSQGMKIGENTHFYDTDTIEVDSTRPWLVEIGNNVTITRGVTILTHGYDLAVLLNYFGELYGSSGKVVVGDNVFIGVNSTILKGVTIGNNVIIGANSLVNKDIPDNVVVAGNPAKIIMSIEEYREKRKKEYIDEAKELIREYRKIYGKNPSHKELREFFPLYLNRRDIEYADRFFMSFEKFNDNFINSKPLFNGIDDLIDSCES